MPQESVASVPVPRPEPYKRGQVQRISQAQLATYWQCKRLVEGFEQRIRAGATAEPGPLTLPTLEVKANA